MKAKKEKIDKTDVRPIFRNLSEALDYWSDNDPEKTFINSLSIGETFSYSAFNRLVNSGVRFLENQGVKKGDTVLLCVRNSIEFLVIYFASARLGSVINPLPSSVGEAELSANIKFIKPKLSLIEEKEAFIKVLNKFSDEPVSIALDDAAPTCLYYSSGTTAKPKGLFFSHKGLMNLVLLMCHGFDHHKESIHLGILPMGHTSVVHHSVLPVLYKGGTFIFSENFMKIRKDFWKIIEKYKINYIQAVPTVIFMILNTKYLGYQRKKLALPYIACGSAPLPESIKVSFEKRFSLRLANLYGLSEAGHLIADYPFKGKWKPGSIGRPLDAIDLKIFNDAGKEVRPNEVGEFVVKTPGFFMGYYKDKKLYEDSFKNGYFKTGDLGYKDKDGLFYYVGRKKDLIIKGGVNISPNLIDEVLIKHPKISEAASVGMPDKFFGETIKSFLVIKPGQKASIEEILKYCRKGLGAFKSPSEIEFVDAIPKTFSGKVLRRKLRKEGG